MAKIVYGVAGEGFGHSSRAHLIGQRLLECGHDVLFAASEKSYAYLRPHFGERVKQITGLCLIYKNRKLSVLDTGLANIRRIGDVIWGNRKVFETHFSGFEPQLAITDFEPFIAAWASRRKIPLLSIDHQHLLLHCRLDACSGAGTGAFLSRLVTRSYRIRAAAYLVVNFFEAPVTHPATTLAPPLLRPVVRDFAASAGNHILYYSTDHTGIDKLLAIFGQFPKQTFYVYGFNQYGCYGNCHIKPTSTQTFLTDLASCRGVISTAGFSLLSECLHFRKKMLLLPIRGQYEQILNAHYIEKLNLGVASDHFDREVLARFLDTLDHPMQPRPGVLWPDNEAFLATLEKTLGRLGIERTATQKAPVPPQSGRK